MTCLKQDIVDVGQPIELQCATLLRIKARDSK